MTDVRRRFAWTPTYVGGVLLWMRPYWTATVDGTTNYYLTDPRLPE